mmetsp:Transcript_47195/g.75366  ORF Transcript_47195/g.75366 Transcript_47195/m.75366 type:complete len:535 (+) Transcript_47195:62-1666(+)
MTIDVRNSASDRSVCSRGSSCSLSSLVESMEKCLKDTDRAGRKENRDEWTITFDIFKQYSKHLDVPNQDDRVVILSFLHALPDVSRIHLRQAECEVNALFKCASGKQWLDTANGLLSRRSQALRSSEPWQACTEKRGPLHTAYDVYQGEKIPSRTRECLCLILLLVVFISTTALILLGCKKSRLVIQWWRRLCQTSIPTLASFFAVAALSIVVFLWIVVKLFLAVVRLLSFMAALVILTFVAIFFVAIACFTNSLLNTYLQEEYRTYKGLILACTLPWNILVVANAHRVVAQLSEWLLSRVLNLWSHISVKCCRRSAGMYSHLTLDTQLRGAAKIAGKIDTLRKTGADQRLLLSDTTDIKEWATLLKKIVHEDERYCFHGDCYQELVYSLHRCEKATLGDLCRFCAWRFISAFCHVIVRSFKRNRELSRAKRSIKLAFASVAEHDQATWQILLDQLDWFCKCGYCFTDIMAWIAGHDDRAVRVVGLLKVVDDAMSLFLCLFCQNPLFVPTPEERAAELAMRLDIISALSYGRYV